MNMQSLEQASMQGHHVVQQSRKQLTGTFHVVPECDPPTHVVLQLSEHTRQGRATT